MPVKKNLLLLLLCITAFAGCTKDDFLLDYRSKFIGHYAVEVSERWSYYGSGAVVDTTYKTVVTFAYHTLGDQLRLYMRDDYRAWIEVKPDGTLFNPEGEGKIESNHLQWIYGYHGAGYIYSLNISGGKIE